ncbi:organic cation transporter protein-like [Nilaparvata lugens]|uniref:organic cation transporter protein-like n=1 Tax=Nilaparvata lugens TaxID=108931 RepID=UPI00193E6777|nr:organic cation transporter protein-like [Nilaparvata lugens]
MTATTDTDENSEHKKDEFHDLLLENESVDAKKGEMAYDDVLEHLGEFGRYQKRIYFLLCLPAISCAFHKLVGVFIQARVPYRCKLSWEPSTSNYGFLRNNMSTYYPMDQLTHTFSGCKVIDLTSNSTSECDSWVYDRTNYESTTLTEWDLVCHKAWWKASADAIFMIGVLLGSIIFGALSDKYGRRIIFFISLILQACAGVLTGLAPNYFIFVFLRMIVGAATSGVFLVAYVLDFRFPKSKFSSNPDSPGERKEASDRLVSGFLCEDAGGGGTGRTTPLQCKTPDPMPPVDNPGAGLFYNY